MVFNFSPWRLGFSSYITIQELAETFPELDYVDHNKRVELLVSHSSWNEPSEDSTDLSKCPSMNSRTLQSHKSFLISKQDSSQSNALCCLASPSIGNALYNSSWTFSWPMEILAKNSSSFQALICQWLHATRTWRSREQLLCPDSVMVLSLNAWRRFTG